jgi:hypothetical protein
MDDTVLLIELPCYHRPEFLSCITANKAHLLSHLPLQLVDEQLELSKCFTLLSYCCCMADLGIIVQDGNIV